MIYFRKFFSQRETRRYYRNWNGKNPPRGLYELVFPCQSLPPTRDTSNYFAAGDNARRAPFATCSPILSMRTHGNEVQAAKSARGCTTSGFPMAPRISRWDTRPHVSIRARARTHTCVYRWCCHATSPVFVHHAKSVLPLIT